jgi:ubiquinone biosynthesis protein UbiJ
MDEFAAGLGKVLADIATETSSRALHADPELRARLQSLEGRCIEICCDLPPVNWHLVLTNGAINFNHGKAVAPQVSVRGTALELASWLSPASTWVSGAPAQVEISGDDTLLLELVEILRDFSPDIETPLSRVLGPEVATTLLGSAEMGIKGLQSLIEGIGFSLQDRVAGTFVQQEQLNALLTGIDDLRLRVDRLAAKVSQREQTQQRANPK